jgi:SAM-dependent methyltransferase
MPSNSLHLVGLFDFSDYWDIVHVLSHALHLPEAEVHERLFKEAVDTGWNVRSAVSKFGATPHVYDGKMEEFYKHTDAFVFELLIAHQSPYVKEIDRRVTETIETQTNGNKNLQILFLGDGIGTDSLRFAEMGHNVTFFEFESPTSKFALYRFNRRGLNHRITVRHKLEDIPVGQFDVVICREVLEHVSDPPSVIDNVWGYLKNRGIAIITESFGRVEPAFPTHLAENQKYDGKTEHLFINAGFRLLSFFPDRRPMVFQKTEKSDNTRFKSLNHHQRYVIQGIIGRIGRYFLNRIRF